MVVSLYYICIILGISPNALIVLFRDTTWEAIKDAGQNARNIAVNLENDMRFRLEWEKRVYYNPIDEKEYSAPRKMYRPSNQNSYIQRSEIVFLVEPPPGAVNMEDFGALSNRSSKSWSGRFPLGRYQYVRVDKRGDRLL